jgi:hypothetical protein
MEDKRKINDLRYENEKMMLDNTYHRKKEEEIKIIEDFWRDFIERKSKLEEFVKGKFLGEVNCINLNGAKVLDSEVKYNGESGKYNIRITQWKSPDGRIKREYRKNFHNSKHCPHEDLAPILGFMDISVDPLIQHFKEKYSVDKIIEPENDCKPSTYTGENI